MFRWRLCALHVLPSWLPTHTQGRERYRVHFLGKGTSSHSRNLHTHTQTSMLKGTHNHLQFTSKDDCIYWTGGYWKHDWLRMTWNFLTLFKHDVEQEGVNTFKLKTVVLLLLFCRVGRGGSLFVLRETVIKHDGLRVGQAEAIRPHDLCKTEHRMWLWNEWRPTVWHFKLPRHALKFMVEIRSISCYL